MRRSTYWMAIVVGVLTGCARPTDTPTPTPGPLGVILPTFTPRATRLPGERTPLPTFTPAPTPTPVVHIVQPGETLIDIAQQYGITLDALQAANGVLTPETLQIGQQLIIPIGSGAQPAPGGGLLLPTPTPVPVTIQGTALYETPAGSVWVLGEVHNPGAASLENTQVRVALLDASGAEVASGNAFTALDVIPANGASPFGVLFVAPPAAVSFTVTVIRAEASPEPGNRYMPIAIASQESALAGLQFKVNGSLVNQGNFNAAGVSVVLTTYDATGRVTGYRQITVGDGTLAAGGAAEFTIDIVPNGPVGSIPDHYVLAAQGRTAQP
ncbi:MAG TPA: FxLYD domain-containing protein [Anaerolineae bacterium]|nr:FxLYD domain-containing protein [Anaerolineae bacterium]